MAQSSDTHVLNIGDPAPALKVNNWLKGGPFNHFEKGKVYVLEFWATWCKPCKAAMPHFTLLSKQYAGKAIFLSIDVLEIKNTEEKIKKFLDSMNLLMDYPVATDKDKYMENHWVKASGNEGIPKTIIVNADSKIAWTGHPKDIATILPKILNNTWDINQAAAQQHQQRILKATADSINFELLQFRDTYQWEDKDGALIEKEKPGRPDSMLYYISNILQQEPLLEYEPVIAFNTLYALLKIDPKKAIEYGKKALSMPNDYLHTNITGAIELRSSKLQLPAAIYELGAEAIQKEIEHYPYPELVNIPKQYHIMAWWYWLAKNKSKAIEAEESAIISLQSRSGSLASELSLYNKQLVLYNTCNVED